MSHPYRRDAEAAELMLESPLTYFEYLCGTLCLCVSVVMLIPGI